MTDENVDIRVRLQGAKVVSAEARGVASSVDSIGDAAQRSGRQVSAFGRMSSRISAPLGAIGSATRTAGMYLGGFGAAATAFATVSGIKFNATMEQNEVAFKNFLGSSKKARAYLDDLYDISARTPFEFPDATLAARKFLAFGYSARQAKNMLVEVADAVSGIGGGTDEITRLTTVLGQMKAKGKVQAEELMQLSELGLGGRQWLKDGLGMDNDQLEDSMRKGEVTATAGIKAIRAGMRKEFGGMSADQAKTFNGQMSALKDNFNQAMGKATKPAFDWMKDSLLPGLNNAMPGITAAIENGLSKLPGAFAAVKGGVETFLDAIAPAKPLWDNVLQPLLEGFVVGIAGSLVGAVKVAIPVIKILATALGFVGTIMKPFSGIIRGIGTVISFVFGGVWLKAIGTLGKFGGIFRVVGSAAKVLSWPIRAVGSSFKFVLGFAGRLLGMLKGPLWSVFSKLPMVLQGAGAAFSVLGRAMVGAVRGAMSKVLGILGSMGGKLVAAGGRLWNWIKDGFVRAVGTGLGFAGDLGKPIANAAIGFLNGAIPDKIPIPGAPDLSLPANPIPMLAKGGTLTTSGSVIVGDAGPEVLSLGKGARVDPLPKTGALSQLGGGGSGVIELTAVTNLNGREIGRAFERYATDRLNGR